MANKEKFFLHSDLKNVKIFYLLTIFTNGWFINANWVFFALSLMNKATLGLVDGLAFFIGTLVDLPSGALADLLGRKITIIFSRLIFTLSCLLFIIAPNAWIFSIANILFFIGTSFYVGADQALLYDSLKERGREKDYLKISMRNDLLLRITVFVSAIMGAVAFAINMRYPFVLLFIFSLFSLATALFLDDVQIAKKRTFTIKNFASQQAEGIRVLLNSKLKVYFPIFFVILGTSVIFGWGILRAFIAMEYNFGGSEQSVIFGSIALLIGLLGLFLPHLIKRSSEYRITIFFSLLFPFSFLVSGLFLSNKVWGIMVLFLISLSGGIINILSQKIVNDEVSSHLRATTLSALSILTKIPYILSAYFIGLMANSNRLNSVTRTIVFISICAVLVSIILKKLFINKLNKKII